ncbi:MAG: EthD family reductase [Stellaceae bacterium]
MIKVSVLYPSDPSRKFDMGYYLSKHMPLVQQKLGAACKSMAVEQGVSGAMPGSQPAYVAMGHMYFDTLEAFQKAFSPVADALLADIPNYTDIQPVFQVSEVKL